jgi:hypothetical protein
MSNLYYIIPKETKTLPDPDPELVKMQSLNEYDFTQNHVIPLFKEKGFLDVRYTGGNEEHGRDVTLYDFDRFGNREDIAAQVKVGDIGGVNVTRTVINEAIAAYENPFVDSFCHQTKQIHVLYVITSGKITVYSANEIKNALAHYPRIYFLNGANVLDMRRQALSQYLELSRAETVMNSCGLNSLLLTDTFIEDAEKLLVLLFNDRGVSELEAINDLPKLLIAIPAVRERVEGLDSPMRSSVLHWFSIRIVTKAWYVYGSKKRFGLNENGTG